MEGCEWAGRQMITRMIPGIGGLFLQERTCCIMVWFSNLNACVWRRLQRGVDIALPTTGTDLPIKMIYWRHCLKSSKFHLRPPPPIQNRNFHTLISPLHQEECTEAWKLWPQGQEQLLSNHWAVEHCTTLNTLSAIMIFGYIPHFVHYHGYQVLLLWCYFILLYFWSVYIYLWIIAWMDLLNCSK